MAAILTRLKARRISTFAVNAAWTKDGENHDWEVANFPHDWWDDWDAEDPDHLFWSLGDITYGAVGQEVHFTDARFDPIAIRKIVDDLRPSPTPSDLAQALAVMPTKEAQASSADLPSVPQAKLVRWYEFYQELYPPELQNNDSALDHARQTFPKNHVTRQRIRDIRQVRRPGRRPAADFKGPSAE